MELLIETAAKYWIQFFMGLFSGGLVYMWKKIAKVRQDAKTEREEQIKVDEALKDAMKAILRDRIYQSASHFIHEGKVSSGSLRMLKNMYANYIALGDGDPVIPDIMQEVERLPLEVRERV